MDSERFEELFEQGRDAVLAGTVPEQDPPAEGDLRWGLTVVVRPEESVARRIEHVTEEAMAVAGDMHWPTGAAISSHFTIRTLECFRTNIPDGDIPVARYLAALREASKQVDAFRLKLTGLILTPRSVMLCASPVGGVIERFACALASALGDDAWFEAQLHRNIWYSNLVHFTEPPRDPQGLVEWVAARRRMDMGSSLHTHAGLVAWKFNGRHVVPQTLGTAELISGTAS
jgi:hypothetical protein